MSYVLVPRSLPELKGIAEKLFFPPRNRRQYTHSLPIVDPVQPVNSTKRSIIKKGKDLFSMLHTYHNALNCARDAEGMYFRKLRCLEKLNYLIEILEETYEDMFLSTTTTKRKILQKANEFLQQAQTEKEWQALKSTETYFLSRLTQQEPYQQRLIGLKTLLYTIACKKAPSSAVIFQYEMQVKKELDDNPEIAQAYSKIQMKYDKYLIQHYDKIYHFIKTVNHFCDEFLKAETNQQLKEKLDVLPELIRERPKFVSNSFSLLEDAIEKLSRDLMLELGVTLTISHNILPKSPENDTNDEDVWNESASCSTVCRV